MRTAPDFRVWHLGLIGPGRISFSIGCCRSGEELVRMLLVRSGSVSGQESRSIRRSSLRTDPPQIIVTPEVSPCTKRGSNSSALPNV